MRRPLVLALAFAGCGPGILDPILTAGSASSGPGDTTALETGPPAEASASISSTSGPATDGTSFITSASTVTSYDDCTFVCPPTTTGDDSVFIMPADPPAQCDVWAQDCPAGEKCAAAGPPPLTTGSIACAAIVPGPDQLGEPCQVLVEGHLGPDTCDLGLYCHSVDPATQQGTCRPLCTGHSDDPACPSGQVCLNTALPMCFAACDPLVHDCAGDDTCIWIDPQFGCFPAGNQPKNGLFEACEYLDQCEDGLICVDPAGAGECDLEGVGCCLPFCDLDFPDTCPGVGQVCQPFHQGKPPAGLEHLGLCSLPSRRAEDLRMTF
ncbi:hypothetical protein [Nannocystis punicea]|uniref:Uncharacterized protein n=1 Tax=Nannocystis punicea TaxID=2995304 RepID=A0ABY7H3L8_9BACT|nr:hypothetical protein [Nannocystis poenicansa]WAS93685.1 hypothetical protein O0S08_46730 [Nannocystis poenicansa]